ncbi:probable enoyl-CoA hydratase isoform X2 [Anastrepha ludens]|uniref:probable enoyl-CoA hydratase isoform X2 n=1 Tax=Anastrepha ludens TaxID=28586 RepID=UPI0023B178E3|nr:probable enoyl-CoA hydratase isoform X2 [Anastrepha ludens]
MANILRQYRSNSLQKLLGNICLRKKQYFSTEASENNGKAGPLVLVDKDDHITLIGLNRPNNRNSIDNKTARCLSQALASFEADETSPVAVIYGIGGSLCTGQDLTELEARCKKSDFNENYSALSNHNFLHRHSKKPIICGINGYCVADGLELAIFCDLRIMEDTAVLGFFGRCIGLNLKCGGTARLPAIIGYSRSMDLLLTGRRVGGQEALQIGLVNRLVATGTALGQAVNLAFSIAKFPLKALQRDRNNLYTNHYERRNGFCAAIGHETVPIHSNIVKEIGEGVTRFKNSKTNGSKIESWQVKPKALQTWEKEEELHEKRFASNANTIQNNC